jgi:hypothetical protein
MQQRFEGVLTAAELTKSLSTSFIRTSEGELLEFGAVAFSKSEDRALSRQVIDIFGTKN